MRPDVGSVGSVAALRQRLLQEHLMFFEFQPRQGSFPLGSRARCHSASAFGEAVAARPRD